MCLYTHFQRRLELMAPGEQFTLTRRDLEFLLERYGSCSNATEEASRVAEAARKNTAAVAKHYDRSESTVRGWIRDGWFGPAEMLKPNGRDYEVPRAAIERVDRLLDEGNRFMDGEWSSPRAAAGTAEDVSSTSSHSKAPPTNPTRTSDDKSGITPVGTTSPPKQDKPRRRPRHTAGKYGDWRAAAAVLGP